MEERSVRKVKEGVVLSNKMKNTVTVRVDTNFHHPKYSKLVKRWTKCYAHTEENIPEGSVVKIMETRPLSKLKRWRVIEIIHKEVETV
ncbi:MAG TPA: 30S ribosomal protein S17 [Chlamydiales bacterium]|nr:30S ribosomal protein S17 [Chlamydiales bacterium]